MKLRWQSHLFLLVLVSAVAACAVGCKRQATAVEVIAPEQVPQTLTESFKAAPAPVVAAARPAIEAARASDPRAIFSLSELASRPDLSPEQREAVARSLHAMLEQARKAAAQGDRRSEAAMKAYRASK